LEEAFDQASEGATYCITRYRDAARVNLRTQLVRIIHKAGLEPWEKPWQNMRSSRETELAETFPMHVVCKWIGNTQPVAAKHYLQLTDEHFARAIGSAGSALQNPVQQVSAEGGNSPQPILTEPGNCGILRAPASVNVSSSYPARIRT
jgi:hypothetical protein